MHVATALLLQLALNPVGPVDITIGPLLYDVSPRPIDFGVVRCDAESTQQLLIQNTGKADLVVVRIKNAGDGAIRAYNDGSGVWAAGSGSAHHINVGFRPTSHGQTYRGTVSFAVEYHDQQIAAERARLHRVMDPEIDREARKLAALKAAGPDVDIIDTLKLKAEIDHQKKANQLDADIRKADSQASALELEKIRVLEEYRQGLFCSGCGKTKSEIEATGSVFPHPGQHVVAATEEQIRAKAAEYDNKIANARQKAANLRNDYQRAQLDYVKRLQELDQKRKLVEEQWQTEVANLQRDLNWDTDRRAQLMKKLDDMLNYSEGVQVAVTGKCKNGK